MRFLIYTSCRDSHTRCLASSSDPRRTHRAGPHERIELIIDGTLKSKRGSFMGALGWVKEATSREWRKGHRLLLCCLVSADGERLWQRGRPLPVPPVEYSADTPAQIHDIDGDGRDDVLAGYERLGPDGSQLARVCMQDHPDAVYVGSLLRNRADPVRILKAGGEDGLLSLTAGYDLHDDGVTMANNRPVHSISWGLSRLQEKVGALLRERGLDSFANKPRTITTMRDVDGMLAEAHDAPLGRGRRRAQRLAEVARGVGGVSGAGQRRAQLRQGALGGAECLACGVHFLDRGRVDRAHAGLRLAAHAAHCMARRHASRRAPSRSRTTLAAESLTRVCGGASLGAH